MKIALSSSGKNLGSSLDLRFGRCSYFIIYDLETGQFKTVDNKGQSSSGGAGIAAAQQLIDESVETVITGNVGPNAHELLISSNIKIYKGDNILCKDLIKAYKEGKLTEIKEAGPAHHGGGK